MKKLSEIIDDSQAIIDKHNLDTSVIYMFIEAIYQLSRSEVILNIDKEVDEPKINEFVNRYVNGESPQYITGYQYFLGNKFEVTPDVLIPRFETEEVVLEAIEIINTKAIESVIDVGVGSGVIATTLALETDACVEGVDISTSALAVARSNANRLGAKVKFFENDLLDNVEDKYQMIISNPPYISFDDILVSEEVRRNEPSLALYAKNDGCECYERILKTVESFKNVEVIVFEIGYNQAENIEKLAHKYLKCKVKTKKDINGNDRIIVIEIDGGNYGT